jgi:DNA-directed RNA polymerase subunit K/omega
MGMVAVRGRARSRSRPRPPRGPPSLSRKGDGSDSEVLVGSESQRRWGNFHLTTLVFRRALQLRAGARPRIDPAGHKLGHVAFLEVTAGAIPWEIGRDERDGRVATA